MCPKIRVSKVSSQFKNEKATRAWNNVQSRIKVYGMCGRQPDCIAALPDVPAPGTETASSFDSARMRRAPPQIQTQCREMALLHSPVAARTSRKRLPGLYLSAHNEKLT